MLDKKELIIEVATQLFSEKGYENTPLSLVCETAKVSKGLIFHHFKSKDHLLRAIFSKTTEMIKEINRAEEKENSPQEKLHDLLESFFTQLEADQLFFQLNLTVMVQPTTRALLNDLINERSTFILNSVKSIFEELNPKNALVQSYLFIAELDGIAINYLSIFENYPLSKIKAQLIQKYTTK